MKKIGKQKGVQHSGINYEVLKDKWFRSEQKTFKKFLEDENITKYAHDKVKGWVKLKKEYIQDRLNKARKNVDKEVEEDLAIKVNELLKAKIEIIDTLIGRIGDIKEKGKKYTYNDTSELISINTVIKTELGEASDIQKIEGGEGLFAITIIPKQ